MSSFRVPELEPLPARKRTGAVRRLVAFLVLLLALALIAGIVAMVLTWNPGSQVAPGKPVVVNVPAGADANTIAELLQDSGVVRNKVIFVARLRLNDDGSAFKSGRYEFKTASAYQTIVGKLEAGPPPAPVFNINLPEGMRSTEMVAQINRLREQSATDAVPLPAFTGKQYAAAVKQLQVPAIYAGPQGTRSKEGFLFPATYELLKGASAQDLVNKQLEAFVSTMQSIDFSAAKKANLTPYEIIIIASMVEREARIDADRKLIAGVIYNRLRLRMTLGIDATIQYAVSGPGAWKTQLTESDLAIDSPYNTRLRLGLPPTPIANPGRESLEAAAHPATTKFLYYVADPEGSGKHHFHENFTDFLNDPYQP